MAQGTPQFSPAQVLEAGCRAEAEGKFDYAVQFYRHLVTHFATSAEAGAARDGLDRIERGGGGAPVVQPLPTTSSMVRPGPRTGGVPTAAAGTAPYADGLAARPGPYLNGADPHHYGAAAASWPGQTTPASYGPAPHAALPGRSGDGYPDPVGRGTSAMTPMMLPIAEDGYRMGRWLARIFSAIGWLMFVGGIALLAATPYVERLGISVLNMLTAFGPSPLGAVACVGLWLVFSGQRARAAFDIANSSQELVAIERAKHGR